MINSPTPPPRKKSEKGRFKGGLREKKGERGNSLKGGRGKNMDIHTHIKGGTNFFF